MKKSFLKTFCLVLLFLFTPFLYSAAQDIVSQNANLSLSINPVNPSPGDQVTISLQSYSLDLDRSTITWTVDGVTKKTDLGVKSYSLQADKAGIPVTVKVKVEYKETLLEKELTFTPAGIDLLYEAYSYVPPFYKGKALNTVQGGVVIVAFPEMFDSNGRKFKTQELVYSWKKDDIVVADNSGVGKNYFVYSGTIPDREVKIEVVASSLDRSISANQSLTIPTGNPKIIFYENNPIYGIMTNRAIKKNVQLLNDEFSVIAVPYFFGVGYSETPDLNYSWTLNGQKVQNQERKNIFTVRQEKEGSGTANLGLKINSKSNIFQFVDNNFIINFQKQ